MGAFDDLMPRASGEAGDGRATPARAGGAFDDLMPGVTRQPGRAPGAQKSLLEHIGDVVIGGPVAVGETLLNMGTNFAGAVPAAVAGAHRAITTGDVTEYPKAFAAVQEAATYEPRTRYGKKATEAVGDAFHAYSTKLVDPVAEATPGGPLAQAAVKTAGEAIPLVAPFVPGMLRSRRKLAEPIEARAETAPIEPARTEPGPFSDLMPAEAATAAKPPISGALEPVTVRQREPLAGKAIPPEGLDFRGAFSDLAGGISDSLYRQAFESLSQGKDVISGVRDPIRSGLVQG